MAKLAILMILLPTLAIAQGLRDSDRVPEADELASRLAGFKLTFYDGSTATYRRDGRYAYRYTPEDPDWVGRYESGDNGEVCVFFENGSDRCDTYVDADGRLVLITARGLRFPVRSSEPLAQ